MKRTACNFLVLSLAALGRLYAQPQAQSAVPDCMKFFIFTAAADVSVNQDNRQVGCTVWAIAYVSSGFSAVNVTFQSATDNNGTPNAFGNFAGTVAVGVNPNTAVTQASSQFSGFFPWVRASLTSATGSGTVRGVFYGYRLNSVSSTSSGAASDVNLAQVGGTATRTGGIAGSLAVGGLLDVGVTGTGAERPVLTGGVTNAGVVVLQQITADGAVVPSSAGLAQADAVTNTPRVSTASSSGGAQMYNPALGYVFNGATWDRLRGNTTGLAPTSASGALADDISNSQTTFVSNGAAVMYPRVMLHGFDGTTWDRMRLFAGGVVTVNGVGGIGLTDNQAGNAMAMQLNVGGIQGPLVTSGGYKYNGTSFDLARAADLLNFPVATTLTARNSIGTQLAAKDSRWTVLSNPAAGSQATASIAAEASVRHVADTACFAAASTTAPALTALTLNLRDGATGAGTIIATWQIAISAVTGQNTEPFCVEDLNLVGTTNTAMTLEWSAALANLIQSVTLTGYNVN